MSLKTSKPAVSLALTAVLVVSALMILTPERAKADSEAASEAPSFSGLRRRGRGRGRYNQQLLQQQKQAMKLQQMQQKRQAQDLNKHDQNLIQHDQKLGRMGERSFVHEYGHKRSKNFQSTGSSGAAANSQQQSINASTQNETSTGNTTTSQSGTANSDTHGKSN